MKKDSHWRAEVMSATEAEEDVLCSLAAFIADKTYPRNAALFVWFKDTPEKLVSLRYAVDRSEVSGIFLKAQNTAAFVHFSTLLRPQTMRLMREALWHVTRSLTRDIKRSKSAKSGSD